MLILLCLLATAAVHRIWHFEDIFAPLRANLGTRILIDPLLSGLWIAPLTCSLVLLPDEFGILTLTVLACYLPLRGLVWLHDHLNPPKVCTPCAQAAKTMGAAVEDLRSFDKRVILIGTDVEQANKLAQKHPTWVVVLAGSAPRPEMLKNVRGLPLINPHLEILNVVLSGGNATIVLWNVSLQDQWKSFVDRFGGMKAIVWVHVHPVKSLLKVPTHHQTVAPDEDMEHLL
jgi:hypothetical protein